MHPIAFHLGSYAVGSYGLLVTAGILLSVLWLYSQRGRFGASDGEFWALLYAVVAGGLAGGKLGSLILDPDRDWDWGSGWVFWFAVLGAAGAGRVFQLVYNRLYRPRRYLLAADYVVASVPLGHVLGRLGCFMEGCCHGRPTGLPWAVRFTRPESSVEASLLGAGLHPTQLYEAALEAALAAFLIGWLLPRIRAGRFRYGTAFWAYLGLYSLLRFGVEFFRGDERGSFLPGLSPAQWIALAVLLALGLILRRRGVKEREPGKRSLYLDEPAQPREEPGGR